MLRFCLSLALCLLCNVAQAGDLEEGVAAYRNQDYPQALLLLQPLAEQGVPAAQYTLGQMFRHGRGFILSLPEALPWLQAAATNYAPAQIALGELYEAGEGVSQDLALAAEWFQKAADSGSAQGQLHLGVHYIRISPGRDFTKAAAWLTRAAQQNEAEAQYFLARLYLDGNGVAQDRAEAMVWFYRASVQSHAPAQRFLRLLKQAETPDRALDLRELRRQLSAGVTILNAVSQDPSYGFEQTSPIQTGAGYAAEWRYLNALRGPRGELVHYQRIGACCVFDNAAAENGKGFLDQYQLSYQGLAKPLDVYLNMFVSGTLQAPLGFTFVAPPTND